MTSFCTRTTRMRLAAWAACGALLATPASLPAAEEALNQAPADAHLIIAVPSLSGFSRDIADLRQSLNLPAPEMDNALDAFKRSTGLTEGLRNDGPLLVVVPDIQQLEAGPESMLMLVPVSDYGAFVQNLGGEAGDGVTSVQLPDTPQAFAKSIEGFAVLGRDRALVEGYQAGEGAAQAIQDRVGQLGQGYLDEADILLYLNVEAAGPVLLPMVQQGVTQMVEQYDQMAQMGFFDPATAENAKATARLYGAAAETVLREARGVLLTGDLAQQGAGFTWSMGYAPDSQLGQLFPGGAGNRARQQLMSLPSQPFIFATAFDLGAINLQRITEQVMEALPDQGDAMAQLQQQMVPLIQNARSGASAFYVPDQQAMMTGSLLKTLTVVEADNAEQYQQQLRDYIQAMNGVEMPLGMPGQNGQPLTASYTTNYQPNVLQLEGQQVDQYQIMTNMPPELMQQMGPMAGMMNMFTQYRGYIARRDGRIIMTTAADPQLVTSAFQSVEQQGGIGAAGSIARMREEALPDDAAAEFYLNLGGIAQAVAAFGMPVPVQVDDDLPPIAGGLGITQGSLAYRVYVPTPTMQWIGNTAAALQQMMGPGMAPGQGGPGGPGGPVPPPPF